MKIFQSVFRFFRKKAANFSLKQKFHCILAVNFAVFFVVFILSFTICINSYNQLLYKNIAGNLSFSSTTIADNLKRVESLSSLIISNPILQEHLSVMAESDDVVKRYNADTAINSVLFGYFDSIRENSISFLAVNNNHSVNCTNWVNYRKTTPDLLPTLYETARNHNGSARWVWERNNPNGLYLTRSIRQIKNLSLKPLGELVINLDMDQLIHSANEAVTQYGDSYYLIIDDSDSILYQSGALNREAVPPVEKLRNNAYGPVSYQGHHYFAVSQNIPQYEWNYINLIPFESITHSLKLTYRMIFLIVFAGCTVLITVSNVVIRSITIHFDSLICKMDGFSQNELIIPPLGGEYQNRNDEIGKLHQQCDLMMKRIRTLVDHNYVNELLKREAQIKALEAQINPHFLYNTLESINWRAKASGNNQISLMTESLGTLLRATLSNRTSFVRLSYELELVNSYMTIQKLRFEEELDFQLSVSDDLLDAVIPPLSIQPLVENAIHYGMENMIDTCHISITIFREDDLLFIKVQNDGSVMEEHLLENLENQSIKANGFGLGILNINKRIQLLFGEEYGLSFSNEDDFATALITLAYKTEVPPSC